MGDVRIHIPLPVLIVNQHTTDFQLNTLVGDRADITQYGRETCYLLHGNIKQQVLCLLIVCVEGHCQTVLEEARAKPDVIRGGGLPLQILIRLVLDDITRCLLVIDNHRSGNHIGSKLVVTNLLVTNSTYRGTQLDEINILSQVEPLLTVDVPRQT